jgi:hypothetical protein
MDELPQQRRPVGGVARQELVQKGRTGSAEARDHNGTSHDLALDRGHLPPQVEQAEPVLKEQLQFGSSSDPAGEMELGLVVQGGAQAVQGLTEPVVAGIVETRGRAGRHKEIFGAQ